MHSNYRFSVDRDEPAWQRADICSAAFTPISPEFSRLDPVSCGVPQWLYEAVKDQQIHPGYSQDEWPDLFIAHTTDTNWFELAKNREEIFHFDLWSTDYLAELEGVEAAWRLAQNTEEVKAFLSVDVSASGADDFTVRIYGLAVHDCTESLARKISTLVGHEPSGGHGLIPNPKGALLWEWY